MKAWLAAAWLLSLAGPAQEPPAGIDPWSTDVISKDELMASRELMALLKKVERGELPRIEFELDSAKLTGESFETLDAMAHVMLKQPHIKLRIDAHTCTLGSDEYNQDLSERRAKSVADYLIKKGVPPPSIRWKGWGSTHPIADNSTEAGRRRNRRVEFHVVRREWGSIY